MFFTKHRSEPEEVAEGSVHKRLHHFNVVEEAQVISVSRDKAGIPHVCFKLTHIRPTGRELQGTRVLSLSSFSEHFRSGDSAKP